MGWDSGFIVVHLFIKKDWDPALLFHVVGHELVHVDQYVKGRYDNWLAITGESKTQNPEKRIRTKAFMETEAYMWNLEHMYIFCLPNIGDYTDTWLLYYDTLVPD